VQKLLFLNQLGKQEARNQRKLTAKQNISVKSVKYFGPSPIVGVTKLIKF